jgi:hypothetical protein
VTASFWGAGDRSRRGWTLCRRLSDRILVLGGLRLGFVLCVDAFSNSLAPYAYPLLGLVIASVYPMGLIWYTVLCPHDSDGLALLIIFIMAGRDPSAESLMVSLLGIHVVPLVIVTFVLLDLAVAASALRFRPLRAVWRKPSAITTSSRIDWVALSPWRIVRGTATTSPVNVGCSAPCTTSRWT